MTIVSPDGIEYEWNKTVPPTQEEVANLASFHKANYSPAASPQESGGGMELVAGTDEQMQQARARNLQSELGLPDRVDPSGRLPVKDRFWMGMAPPGQKQAYFDVEYGKDGYAPLSNDRAMVRVPDEKGGHKWVIDDPVGFDAGDLAQFSANAPAVTAGVLAAMQKLPGTWGAGAKILGVSGLSAVASNAVAAGTDALYRGMNDLPIEPLEIAKRRGLGTALETAVGVVLPAGVGAFMRSSPAKSAVRYFINEGKKAKAALQSSGIKAESVAGIPDAILEQQKSNLSATQAGNAIAKSLNETDEAIQLASRRSLGRAASDVSARAEAELAASTSAPVTNETAGLAAQGGVGKFIAKSKKAVGGMYDEAYRLIDAVGGAGRRIISLGETGKIADDILANRLIDATGKPIKLGTELADQLVQIKNASGVVQKLEAARNLRSQIATTFRGAGVFKELDEGTAKRIYGALSEDIDVSIAKLTGPGANALRAANEAYKKLIKPFEENSLLSKTADGAWENGVDMVAAYAKAGPKDWGAIKSLMTPRVYSTFRRAVAQDIMGAEPVFVNGVEHANIAKLGKNLYGIADEVKDEVFGSRQSWQFLQRLGREQDFIAARQGIFTSPNLPTREVLDGVVAQARTMGLDVANANLGRAVAAQQARINSRSGSLVSMMRGGNYAAATKDPVAVMEALLGGKYSGSTINGILKKMPSEVRENTQKAAVARVFEAAKDRSASLVSGAKNFYDVNKLSVIGSPQEREAAKALLGPERYKLVEDWAKVSLQTQIELARGGKIAHTIARLVSVLPYGKLLVARTGQEALESAAGKRLISGLAPEYAVAFSEARNAGILSRGSTAAANILIQKASSIPIYEDYQAMMAPYSIEQQNAIDTFLLGQQ